MLWVGLFVTSIVGDRDRDVHVGDSDGDRDTRTFSVGRELIVVGVMFGMIDFILDDGDSVVSDMYSYSLFDGFVVRVVILRGMLVGSTGIVGWADGDNVRIIVDILDGLSDGRSDIIPDGLNVFLITATAEDEDDGDLLEDETTSRTLG